MCDNLTNSNSDSIITLAGVLLLHLIAFGVVWERLAIKCHTKLQVCVGVMMGALFGYGLYQLYLLANSALNRAKTVKKAKKELHNAKEVTDGGSIVNGISYYLTLLGWLIIIAAALALQ